MKKALVTLTTILLTAMAHAGNGEVGSVGGPLLAFIPGCEAASTSGTRLEQLEKISTTMIALDNQILDLQKKYWDLSTDEMRATDIIISENKSALIKCDAIRKPLLGYAE